MSNADFRCLVIGGGVVGLAVAARTQEQVGDVALLEKESRFGTATSSRNSEVVHAGIYYATGSLKARLCVEGARDIYQLAERGVLKARKCGKIIVATETTEVPQLSKLMEKGIANGVPGLRMLSAEEIRDREPNVRAAAGLLSEWSGIMDSHGLMSHFRGCASEAGAMLATGSEVTALCWTGDAWKVRYSDGDGDNEVTACVLVNCAGLGAQRVMEMAGLSPQAMGLALHRCKGEYFRISAPKARLIRSLVYPVPLPNLKSLGIHTVADLGEGMKLGPSAFYVDREDYTVDPSNAGLFAEAVKPYLPFIEEEDLTPDMSGIRPKLTGEGQPARDFHIREETASGAPQFVNLSGIDSPGLTAAPAIGRLVASMVQRSLQGGRS